VINYFQKVRMGEEQQGSRKQKSKAVRTSKDGGLRVLEGLAATGLRSIRYAREIEGDVEKIVANDMDPTVVESMRRNIEFNGVEGKVETSEGDARAVMMSNKHAFDVVDLDPYGAPVQLLDSAMECVSEGGMLLCTATDMAALCGNTSEACFAKYGMYPLHKPYCHEQAIRIVLAAISKAAARYKRYIVPVLSLSIDFYVRVFVRVYSSPQEVKDSALKLSYLYQSQGCDTFTLTPVGRVRVNGNSRKYGAGYTAAAAVCSETGAPYTMGGPIWNAPIHDPSWIKGVLGHLCDNQQRYATFKKLQGLLTVASSELTDVPLYLELPSICKVVKASVPKHEIFKSALLNAGYRVSGSHASETAIKTDAPWPFIWDVVRRWVQDHPNPKLKEGTSGWKIIQKAPEHEVDFSRARGAVTYRGKNTVTRYVQNEKNWGPKTMHGKKIKDSRKRKAEDGQCGEVAAGNGSDGGDGGDGGDAALDTN
jgi:tRNA (guanine26-N2/guanine27-N2)-dimethyltransferase